MSRAAWTVARFKGFVWRRAFYGGCVFLAWLNQLSYVALMGDEYDDAFSYPSKDSNRRNAQILSLGGTILFTTAVVVDFWSVESARKAARNAEYDGVDSMRELVQSFDESAVTGTAVATMPFPGGRRVVVAPAMVHAPFVFGEDAKRGRYAAVPSLSRLGR